MLDEFIRKGIREMVGGGGPPVAFLTPPGDPGLLGPQSVAWKIHADFISMMIGGISSLIMQALHPQALAGVWDHSSFREDLKGRLGRTAFFIAATTYGSREMALQVISKVNRIHTQITGFDEFGKPYKANPNINTNAIKYIDEHNIQFGNLIVYHLDIPKLKQKIKERNL